MSSGTVLLATAGYDHTIRFWQAPTGLCQRTLACNDSQVNCLETTPDKQYIMAAGNPWIRLFDAHSNNPNPVVSYTGHTNNVTGIALQRENKWFVSSSEDGFVRIYDLRAPGYQREYACKSPVNSVALHPNQSEVICVDEDGSMRVWDLTSDKCTSEMVPAGNKPLRSISISADASSIAVGSSNGGCYVWSIGHERGLTPQPKIHFKAHQNTILKCLFSPDSKMIATTSADHSIKLWSATDYSHLRTLRGHTGWVWSCAFSADSAYLVSVSSDKTAKLWQSHNGQAILEYKGSQKPLICVTLNDS